MYHCLTAYPLSVLHNYDKLCTKTLNMFSFDYLDGQNCINNPNISIPGDYSIAEGRHIIMLNLNFACNGRITGVAASMYAIRPSGALPVFQIWRPLSPNSNVYSKIGQVQFEAPQGQNILRIYISNVSLTGNDQIEFQAGDAIGCYQPSNSRYRAGAIDDPNFTSHFTSSSSLTTTTTTIDISSARLNYFETTIRPLISVIIGEYIYSSII